MTCAQLCQRFLESVSRLDPAGLVVQRLQAGDFVPDRVVALGKAAQGMAAGCPDHWGGLVVSPFPFGPDRPGWTHFLSTHPFLSQSSYAAGARLLEELKAPGKTLFLISGGASALVEVCPHDPEGWLVEWRRLYGSGLDVATMNQLRAARSAIKGGQLLDFLMGDSLTLLLSDVLQGPQWVGSGLTWREPQPPQHRLEVLADSARLVREMQNSLSDYDCQVRKPLDGTLAQAVEQIQAWAPAPGQAILAGAEVTLAVTGEGQGGRCQHLAASLVPWLRGTPYLLLAAASDGVDGNSPAAGACVDGTFPDPSAFLNVQDSYHYFCALDCSWCPGPTRNNLNDLIVLLNPRK